MAAGAKRQDSAISQVSWTDGMALDPYYGLEHSFLYAANINCDDEMHGIKLSNRPKFIPSFKKCQLTSLGDNGVMAFPIDGTETNLNRFQYNGFDSGFETLDNQAGTIYNTRIDGVAGVVFQDRYWFASNATTSGVISNVPLAVASPGHGVTSQKDFQPYDHNDYTDESISSHTAPDLNPSVYMTGAITAILNYNNSRLVVAAGQSIWVYYPELDDGYSELDIYGKSGWKKVLDYEAGVTIVGLTCTFEYLKVRAVDEGWNTQVYYYQGNNNLRSTFVYNLVDMPGVKVLHVYNINGIDYFTSSIGKDATYTLIDFNKMAGSKPVKLFTQRAGLHQLDINTKDPYFVGPTSVSAAYNNGKYYIADSYGIFSFTYDAGTRYQVGYDKGYMKWLLDSTADPAPHREGSTYYGRQVYGLCENKGYLYVSTEKGCRAVRLYDTGIDGYQEKGVLISREFEGEFGGTLTKMLDEVMLNYEMNPGTNKNGKIEVYVSPNNLWKSTSSFTKSNNWYKVMELTQTNADTRTEVSYALNNYVSGMPSSFAFDRQTINYAIVITRNNSEPNATPIVRQIVLKYHTKEKTNKVHNLTKNLQ